MSGNVNITYVIPGARELDQLNEPTLDGHPDEDAKYNCVASSVADGLTVLTGKRFVGDELKDAVYGQGFVGVQAAWRYQQYCADRGVTLSRFNGSQSELVATIHRQVAAGHPVVVTMPSQWSQAPSDPVHPSGYTHVGLAVGVGPGAIRVMNPWHGFMQDASDAWWQARLCEGMVWVMEGQHVAPHNTTPVSHPTPYDGLVYTDNPQVWRAPATGQNLSHGFLQFYRGIHGPNGQTGTEMLGLPISGEYGTSDGKTRQDFERGSLLFDTRANDPWRISFAPLGKEVADLRARIAALEAAAQPVRR
ncbi:MAG TPA: hypothetical protein VF792_08085 [Ktedonobacterales bacterium]